MVQIPRSSLDELTRQLSALSEEGKRLVRNALRNAEWDTVAELREILVEAMEAVCGTVADYSAALTAEFYDELRTRSVGEPLGAVPDPGRDPKATEGAVGAFVQSVVETGATDALEKRLMERVDYEAKRASGECVRANAEADPLKPKYARVPTGAETCRFCIMLASRGFVYRTEETAGALGHYHSHCDCRIVPGFPGDEVEGYDLDLYYDMWKHPEKYSTASPYPSHVATKEEAIALAKSSESRVFCVKGDHLIENARNVRISEGDYRVVMHGKPGACYLCGSR